MRWSGLACAVAGVLPRWTGILLALGVPLFFLGGISEYALGFAGGFLIAIGGQIPSRSACAKMIVVNDFCIFVKQVMNTMTP